MLAYLEDRGSSNRAAGHRRWLLAPTTEAMGTGQVGEYNALYVVPPSRLRSERNANPTWIAWPAAGWFPAEMQPGRRWSFGAARPGLGLGKATVRVTVGGKAVPLRLYRPHAGLRRAGHAGVGPEGPDRGAAGRRPRGHRHGARHDDCAASRSRPAATRCACSGPPADA